MVLNSKLSNGLIGWVSKEKYFVEKTILDGTLFKLSVKIRNNEMQNVRWNILHPENQRKRKPSSLC